MSTMYFKTKRVSDTGKRFQAIVDKFAIVDKEIEKLGKELGFNEYMEWADSVCFCSFLRREGNFNYTNYQEVTK